MTIIQLTALLETLSEPARVDDDAGILVASNKAATVLPDSDWNSSLVKFRDLGDGWHLRIYKGRTATKTSSSGPSSNATSSFNAPIQTTKHAAHTPEVHALARGIAHEIRNPLSSILTAINLVRDDPGLTEETGMLLEVVKKEALRMKLILEEFSQYVRPPTPQPDVFDLARTARNAIASLQRDGLLSSEIEVQDELPESLMVLADEIQIGQVLRQIIGNAADSMQDQGILRLSGWQANDKASFCVDDSGPGFSPESLERAFQPFYSKKSQSTGLGLSIAHAAVEAAGGRIWLENRQMPETDASSVKAPAHDKPPSASAKPPRPTYGQGARVCIELPTPARTA